MNLHLIEETEDTVYCFQTTDLYMSTNVHLAVSNSVQKAFISREPFITTSSACYSIQLLMKATASVNYNLVRAYTLKYVTVIKRIKEMPEL